MSWGRGGERKIVSKPFGGLAGYVYFLSLPLQGSKYMRTKTRTLVIHLYAMFLEKRREASHEQCIALDQKHIYLLV